MKRSRVLAVILVIAILIGSLYAYNRLSNASAADNPSCYLLYGSCIPDTCYHYVPPGATVYANNGTIVYANGTAVHFKLC